MTAYPNYIPPVPYTESELHLLIVRYEEVTDNSPRPLIKTLLTLLNRNFSESETLSGATVDSLEVQFREASTYNENNTEIFIGSLFTELVVNRMYDSVKSVKNEIERLLKNS